MCSEDRGTRRGRHCQAGVSGSASPHEVEHVEGVRLVQLTGGSALLHGGLLGQQATEVRDPNLVLIQ